MRGDLLFWPGGPSASDRLIMWWTSGPFVHVSVDLGDGTDIGAHSQDGVKQRPTPPHDLLTIYPVAPEAYHIEAGVSFLEQTCGQPYGYANILNSVLRGLHLPYRISRLGHYDCSGLVAHYLQHIGLDLSDEPDSLSPNDLARSLSVLPVPAPATKQTMKQAAKRGPLWPDIVLRLLSL